jgi:hypothetical protein
MQATLSQIQGWRNQKRLKGSSAKWPNNFHDPLLDWQILLLGNWILF